MALKLLKEFKVGRFQPGEAARWLLQDPDATFAHHCMEEGSAASMDFPAVSNFLELSRAEAWDPIHVGGGPEGWRPTGAVFFARRGAHHEADRSAPA